MPCQPSFLRGRMRKPSAGFLQKPSLWKSRGCRVAALGVLLLAAIAISTAFGRYPIQLPEAVKILLSKILPLERSWDTRVETVLLNVRIPRVVLAAMVGAALSAAGAAYQGIFQTPMASPDLLGASAGASFGAALAILLDMSGFVITASAFFFSLLTVGLVSLVSQRAKGKHVISLILAGIMVSSLFQAGTSFIKLAADPSNQLPAITYWMMGSLAGASGADVRFISLPLLAGVLPLLLNRWRLNVMTLGDDEAQALGVNARSVRLLSIGCATLLTAASVSVSGTIGWVGLLVPHMARRITGNDFRYLLPASILLGSIFLLASDNIARNLLASEIPLGILNAFVGAPFFVSLILKGGDSI